VSVAMAITVIPTVQEKHAKKDLRCLTTENAEETVEVIKLGSVLIIAANAG
jgi:hypothetical protein